MSRSSSPEEMESPEELSYGLANHIEICFSSTFILWNCPATEHPGARLNPETPAFRPRGIAAVVSYAIIRRIANDEQSTFTLMKSEYI